MKNAMTQATALPIWIQSVFGLLLGFLVLSFIGTVWYNRINDAKQDEQISQNKVLFTELKAEFAEFSRRESRAAPALLRIKKKGASNYSLIQNNKELIHKQELSVNKLVIELGLVKKILAKVVVISGISKE